MKLITAEMKMADVVHSNHLLIPVIGRFGITLGFGERTVATVCRKHRINPEFFLAIVNVFGNESYFPERTLRAFDVLTIIRYLQRTHAYYIKTQIPVIERLIKALLRRSGRRNASLALVHRFFLEYKKELFEHLRREETVTFPYMREICRLYRSSGARAVSRKPRVYSMKTYEAEHGNVDEKLTDLQNILLKYLKGRYDVEICNAIVFELFRLERDIKDHTRIEEHIVRPVVADMERALHLAVA